MRPPQANDVFHAIAHPARRAMLAELTRGERAASALAAPFQMSLPAISQHLRVLLEAQLVAERRDGRHRLYRLQPAPLREVAGWVDEFRAFFDARLDALGDYLDRKHGTTAKRSRRPAAAAGRSRSR
jgi:DNA-binding transcriptional ArsR family regulator